jgi:carbon monoxide dehydrogenase subunit G
MPTRIEERFEVRAPIERVWSYLVDPRQVVGCLPGAELTEVVDDRTFHGAVKVKVGPVTVAYKGRVVLGEVDPAAHRVKMLGEGRETGGAGSARMTMESRLAPAPGGTEVTVLAEVDVAGRLVQLGRGMIEQVSHQLFGQFADCVRATLEAAPGAAPAAGAGQPVRAVPLVLRALWAALVAWLRRLFQRR